jgi:hypothetical protein
VSFLLVPQNTGTRTPWLATLVFLYIYAYVAETILLIYIYILQNSSIKESVPGEKKGAGGRQKCWGNVRENLSYIHLGSSVCHPVCHPVIVAERWVVLYVLVIKLTKKNKHEKHVGSQCHLPLLY